MKNLKVYRVPDKLYEQVKEYAEGRGISISDAVKNILKEYLSQEHTEVW